jgi:alpha-N-arabinofuranosidase
MVFLGIRPVWYPPRSHLGRETFLAPVRWENGWPVVGLEGRIKRVMQVNSLPLKPWPAAEAEPLWDEFDQPKLGLHWNFLRNPRQWQYSLTERPSWLRLKGSAETIMDEASPAFVGRRQRHFHVRAETLLEFDPQAEGEEAGLTAFMNHKHHYEIAVTCRDGKRMLIFRRQIGTLKAIEAEQELAQGSLRLFVACDKFWYRFGWMDDQGVEHELGKGEVQYLTTEVGGAFTGVYLAMYAFGSGTISKAPADFDFFRYTVLKEDYDAEDESMLEVPDNI